jgi:putative phosphoesterase
MTNDTSPRPESRIAVLSDIHGNVWALDAVLAELAREGVDEVINLGDCFWGPLAPGETFDRLRDQTWPTVRGNQDRVVLDGGSSPTHRHTLSELGGEGVAWVAEHTRPTVQIDDVLGCHGTPDADDVPLIERVESTHVRLATSEELEAALSDCDFDVVVCGHSHRAGALMLHDGRLVVNPGSVGLPAYQDDQPYPHAMESGTPHARWAILERARYGWSVHLRGTPYDVSKAVEAARRNGREDWAQWIATGRAAEAG